jgi:transcription antitermination factor NusG
MDWCVIHARSNAEDHAIFGMERDGFLVYAPRMLVTTLHRRNKRRIDKLRPLFPGYFFVASEDKWPDTKKYPGVFGILAEGDGTVQLVPSSCIEELQAHEAKGFFNSTPENRIHYGSKVLVDIFGSDYEVIVTDISAAGVVSAVASFLGRTIKVRRLAGDVRIAA